jgi:hypothetical protein
MNFGRFTFKMIKVYLKKLKKIFVIADAGGTKIHRRAADPASAPQGAFPLPVPMICKSL